MPKKPSLPTITGHFASASQLNNAFRAIETAFDNTLSRDGSTPNTMSADLDMNSNDILNANSISAEYLTVNGTSITTVNESNYKFATRADLVTAGLTPENGKVYEAAGVQYLGQTGATTISDLPGLVPNGKPMPQHWGASPSLSDNTAAFNSFFAYIRARATWNLITPPHVVEDGEVLGEIPAGRYTCLGSINATFIRGVGWTVLADGAEILSHATGKAALDLLGSRWGTIRGLKISGHQSNTPRTGFQIGACYIGGNAISSDGFVFDRCKTDGYFTLSAVYNMSSETSHHISPIYFNRYDSPTSYCYVLDGISHFAATSDFIAANVVPQGFGRISNIQHNVFGGEIRKFGGGPAIWMTHTKQVRLHGTYAVSFDDAAIVMVDDGNGQPCFADIDLDVHCETDGLLNCIRFEQLTGTNWVQVFGFRFKDHAPFAADSIFKIHSSVHDRVVLHDADIKLPQYIVLPTSRLTLETNKLFINGDLYAGSALLSACFFSGRLTTDLRSGIVNWPVGRYTVQDATAISYRRGAIEPNEILALENNTATWITPPSFFGKTEFFASTVGCGELAYNTSTPAAVAYNAGSNFAVTTGVLTGTTGTPGNLTVSAHTDGRLYIENRLGVAATVRVLHRIGGTT